MRPPAEPPQRTPAPGTRPDGVDPAQASRYVQAMFASIAGRYDRANHLLSFSVDRYWRWRAVRELRAFTANPMARIVDVCCGTGDLTLALTAARPVGARPVLGTDFTHAMLRCAQVKPHAAQVQWCEADAMRLPFAAESVDAISTAFGFRNLVDYRAALREFHRVLRPGGRLLILEFSRPTLPLLGPLYDWYFQRVLPRLGGWITGSQAPYRYLPASVGRFPSRPELATWMQEEGFHPVRFRGLTGGIASVHVGDK
ncbi:MAG: bifunctional demethylmenaquinone methyltransferase/2-methoxy-6-polyprenyl-1,4-benzoquinol methylase UbiE [Terriglobales bacterium]